MTVTSQPLALERVDNALGLSSCTRGVQNQRIVRGDLAIKHLAVEKEIQPSGIGRSSQSAEAAQTRGLGLHRGKQRLLSPIRSKKSLLDAKRMDQKPQKPQKPPPTCVARCRDLPWQWHSHHLQENLTVQPPSQQRKQPVEAFGDVTTFNLQVVSASRGLRNSSWRPHGNFKM